MKAPTACLAAALPAVVVLALVGVLFQAGPRQFLPWWNDEIIYWNEIAAIGRVGLETGYVTVHERPAPAPFVRSGPHGPVFPLLYGGVARLAGWRPYSAFLVNLVLITLAAFAWLAARGAHATWLDVLLLATFWPLVLYLPTNMQEPLHFMFALLLAAASLRLSEGRSAASTWAWTVPLITLAALTRPTWALMLLPVGWRYARASYVRIGALVSATTAATLVAYMALTYTSAPYPNAQREILELARLSVASALEFVASRTWQNITGFADPSHGQPPEVLLRYLIVTLTVAVMVILVRRWRVHTSHDDVLTEMAAIGLVAPLPLVVSVGWVEDWRDFRILAPHVLYGLLLAAPVARPVRLIWYMSLAALPLVAPTFMRFHQDRFTAGHGQIAAMRQATGPVLQYSTGSSGWANTVLMHENALRYPLLGLPAGIGTSFVLDWGQLPLPPRSRYLLLRSEDEAVLRGRIRMTPLVTTPLGRLYRNESAQ